MTCPICKTTTDPVYRPFCSKRCADRDLGRWMNGNYAVPSTNPEDAEAALDAVEAEVEKALRDRGLS